MVPRGPKTAFCFIQSATTGFITNIFPYRNRVSLKEAFEGLEPDDGKLSRPVLRGPGPSNGVWLLGRQFSKALHQTCLAHLLRRCREMILVAGRGEAEFPRTVQTILQQALQLRDRRQQRKISEHGAAVAQGRLEVRMDRTLERRYRSPQNRRFANHLLREREALFTFLSCPGLEATNWRAEQAIRPMVVTRKVWGGNRTSRGAHTQGILVSILQTCRQQLRSASSILQKLICASQPKPLDLTVPTR